jgi:predicted NBD/HSP70 family sugar kinase
MGVMGQGADTLSQLITELHAVGGAASRAELTERLGCGRSVMGYLLGDLAHRGVVEIDRGVGGGEIGRPSHRVSVAATAPVVIGVSLQVDGMTVATFALGGRIVRRDEVSLCGSATVDEVLGLLAAAVHASVQAAERRRVLGVGLAVPSPVRRDGLAFAVLHLGWPRVPFRELLAGRLDALPLTVGNDANLAALAEYRHGAGSGARQLLYLTTARVGLGGALISNGRLFDGAHGYAMEPGHITVDPSGVPCTCGSTGCLEIESDHRGLLRAAAGLPVAVGLPVAGRPVVPGGPPVAGRPVVPGTGPEVPSATARVADVAARAERVLAAAAAGDEPALSAVRHVTGLLGNGLASLINLTDPDRIVLSGSLARYASLAPDTLAASLAARSFLSHADAVPIVAGELPDAPLLGAADQAFQPLLDDPRAVLDRV